MVNLQSIWKHLTSANGEKTNIQIVQTEYAEYADPDKGATAHAATALFPTVTDPARSS